MNIKKPIQKDRLIRYWQFAAIMSGIFILLFRVFISYYPEKVEYGYSRAFYPYIVDTLAWPGRLIPSPFSASEIFIALMIGIIIVGFFLGIVKSVKKKWSFGKWFFHMVSSFIAIIALVYFCFMLLWGLNYLREPFAFSLRLDQAENCNQSDFRQLAADLEEIINSFHEIKDISFDSVDSAVLDQQVNHALKKIVSPVLNFRTPSFPATKKLVVNEFMNICGIAGIFLPIFMEPHINADLLSWEQPVIMAHEKAHFLGFASESDANFIAYMACLSSDSDLLKYSAALTILYSLHSYLPEKEWRRMITRSLTPEARADIRARGERLRRHQAKYKRTISVSRKVNDRYLKANSQKLGVASYQAALPNLARWWKLKRFEAMMYPIQKNR